ncbi:extracellular solute-binding protein [Streptomyces iconiensis]|uniref:Extracellular solute-binding protein n=1 Tax=Streptomyces iconiensis TaxID=1384038 RepID=A0ABT7A6P8_9ACTN|nr:extracellular solute-binding protein [Streptomyces iconiensis]MDJ1137010.1 extracellular solute-binding protein [Streptomyces iconiensis]
MSAPQPAKSSRTFRRPVSLTAVAVGTVLSLTALTGCGGGGGGGAADASGEVKGEITFQTWNLRAQYKDFFNGLVAKFEEKYPDAKVRWVDKPAEGYAETLSADAASEKLPDVVNVSPDLAYPLAKAGALMNLSKDETAAKYEKEYMPAAWKGNEMPGLDGVFGYPWYLNTGPMFYNKSLFKKAGLDPEKPPENYAELFSYGEKLAKKDVAALAAAPTIEDFGRYGVPLMNKEGTEFTYNSAKGVELMTKYKKLFDQGGMDSQAMSSGPEKAGEKFEQEKVAMNPGGAQDLTNFQENQPQLYKNIGITEAPNNNGRPNMYVMSLGVAQNSKNKAAAVAFAHFVTNQKNQEAFARKVAVFPSTKGSLDKPYWTKNSGSPEDRVRVSSARLIEKAVNYTPVVMTDPMKTVLQKEASKVFLGKKSPKQALDDAVAESNKLLKQV